MKTLEEMKARLGEIQAKLGEFKALESFTPDQVTEINELHAEFSNLKTQIEARQIIEGVDTAVNASTRQVAPVATVVTPGVKTTTVKNGGFESAGEFFASVAQGGTDSRFKNEMFEKHGSDGGFLIPGDYVSEIQKKVVSDESLLPMTRQFNTSSNSLTLPVSEVAAWDGTGIQAYWEGEGDTYSKSKTKFGTVTYRLHKLTALVPVSEELLEDAPALESWIKTEAPEAIMHKVNKAMIDGSGTGQPQGILNSGFLVTIDAEVGQDPDTVVYNNIVNMEAALLPAATNAIWLIHPSVLPELRKLKFDEGAASPVPAYLPANGLAGRPFETLMGREMRRMMGSLKQLGDKGDIILVDFKYMITALKTAGIKQSVSTHVYFDRDLTAFKFSLRVAGQCPFKEPVTTEEGDYKMSGFIALDDR